jgi:hypothetical protein
MDDARPRENVAENKVKGCRQQSASRQQAAN